MKTVRRGWDHIRPAPLPQAKLLLLRAIEAGTYPSGRSDRKAARSASMKAAIIAR